METKEKVKGKKHFNNLIKKISQGEKKALEDFYSAYGRMIYSVAASVSQSSFLADEIVDDVLVKIWLIAKELTKIEKPYGWLYTVTKNCTLDRIKKEKQLYEIYDMLQDDVNLDKLEADDSFNYLISRLNEEERQIIILHFIQDLTFKEIAKEVDRPVSTISSIFYRAIEKLRSEQK